MKKQKQIAKWLKGLCVLLGIMGLAFFGGLTWVKFQSGIWFVEDKGYFFIGSSWFIALLCYAVLYQFWKVCVEIGKDNSFSLENAKCFHMMAIYGVVAGIAYVVRLLYLLVTGVAAIIPFIYVVAMVLLAIVFVIVCEALSQLIRNAYEVKLENDLTI